MESNLLDEVESLEAILMDDVNIHRNSQTNIPEIIETTIFPIGNESEKHICVTLQVIPSNGYPDVSPKFNLLKPRGLDDQRLSEIKYACLEKLKELCGYPVVFDLIEVIREHLTGSSLPSGQCVVCLYGFHECDEYTKTECFHYLHSFCLARHLIASKKNWQEEMNKLPAWLKKTAEPFQPVCPVCREKIPDNVDNLKDARAPSDLENAPDFKLTKDLKELQIKMSNLYLRQKSKGGIIDISAEEKNVISIETEEQMLARLEQERIRKLAAAQVAQKVLEEAAAASENGDKTDEDDDEEKDVPKEPNGCNSASSSRVTVNHTNFAPIINTAPTRYVTTEPTNNNPQFNRRHYRGGNKRFHRERFRGREGDRDVQQQAQHNSTEEASATANGANNTENNSQAAGGTPSNGKNRFGGKNHKSGSHKR